VALCHYVFVHLVSTWHTWNFRRVGFLKCCVDKKCAYRPSGKVMGLVNFDYNSSVFFFLAATVSLSYSCFKLCIKFHGPTSPTQKLKLIGRGGQFTYFIFQHSPHVEPLLGLRRGIGVSNNYLI
jgi:hypothetical protein